MPKASDQPPAAPDGAHPEVVPAPSRPPIAERVTAATRLERAPTELLLIRHGEKAPVTPEDPDPPLTELGEQQAELLAQRLTGATIDAVCASTMLRARQTAQPLAAAHGLEVATFADLREVELGDWADGGFTAHAEARDEAWLAFAAAGRWDAIPGSEGDDAFRARVRGVLDELVRRHAHQRVAVVCHGGVINAALADRLGLHRSFGFPTEHTGISVLVNAGQTWFASVVNDCNHLYDPAATSVPLNAG